MNHAGETDDRLRFAREVVRQLTQMLRKEPGDSLFDLALRGGFTKLRMDEILLDVMPDEPEIVVLFRDIANPEYLHEFRMEASIGGGDDAYIEATIIWANFVESIEGGPGMRGGRPDAITKIDW